MQNKCGKLKFEIKKKSLIRTLTGAAVIQRKIVKTNMEIHDNILIRSAEQFHQNPIKMDFYLYFETHTLNHNLPTKN